MSGPKQLRVTVHRAGYKRLKRAVVKDGPVTISAREVAELLDQKLVVEVRAHPMQQYEITARGRAVLTWVEANHPDFRIPNLNERKRQRMNARTWDHYSHWRLLTAVVPDDTDDEPDEGDLACGRRDS